MATVSTSTVPSTVPSYRDRIDASAEREGVAVDTLYSEYMDEPAPETTRQLMLSQARAAEALGIQRERVPNYCRHAAVMAWLRICDGRPYQLKLYWENDNDRLRQAARRIRRAELLDKLRHVRKSRWIGLPEAAKLTALGERTLQRACIMGRIPARREFTPRRGRGDTGRWVVRVYDLRRLLADKLGGKAVAA